ncbi:MAG: ATP-binding protein [Elusimicrobiota bacterium]
MEEDKPKRVLVVDDEENIRNISKRILEKKNFVVDTEGTAERGYELQKDKKFNVILLDIDLPAMNGIELLKKLKDEGTVAEIIMVSGKGTVEDAVKAMKRGAYDYVTKPFDIHELRNVVNRAAEKQSLTRQLDVMKSVNSITEQISQLEPAEEIMDKVLSFLINATSADGGNIGICEGEENNIIIKTSQGIDRESSGAKETKEGDFICGWVVEHKEPVFLNKPASEDKRFKDNIDDDKITARLSIPLRTGDEVIGVINLKKAGTDKKFSRKEFDISSVVARQLSYSIQKAFDYEKLLELSKLKDEFIANVSHELRTPLQSIMASCEIIEKNHPESKMAEICMRNSKRMHRLITQLLDFSRWDAGEFSLEREKLIPAELCSEIVEDISHKTEKKNIDIKNKIKKEHKIYADRSGVKRVLVNLLDNSIKYSDKGSKIEIFSKKKTGYIEITVKDNGKGIPPKEKKKIFDRFHQQEPGKLMTEKHKGLGLGLSMVKKIVEAHDGKVGVESKPKEGSSFYFTIPEYRGDKKNE